MQIHEKVDAVREYVQWRERNDHVTGPLDGPDLKLWERDLRFAELGATLGDVSELLAVDAAVSQAELLERLELARRTIGGVVGGLQ